MKILAISALLVLLLASAAAGAEAEAEAEAEVKETRTIDDLSTKELVENIEARLDYHSDVLTFVPQVKAHKDEEGNVSYTYTSEDGLTRGLERLDRKTLIDLFGKISGEINRLNNERLIKQLEQIKRAQQPLPGQTPQTYTPPKMPSTPKIYTPPKVPTTPKIYTPPKVPETPKTYEPPKVPTRDRTTGSYR